MTRLHEEWITLATARLGDIAYTLVREELITEAERNLRVQGLELVCHAWATWTMVETADAKLAIEEQLESSGWGWPS